MINGKDGLIRLSEEDMTKLAELEGRLIDWEKELSRARLAGLTDDVKVEKREADLIVMRRKIKKMKEVYKPLA